MSVRQKLLASFTIVLMLMVAVGGIALYSFNQTQIANQEAGEKMEGVIYVLEKEIDHLNWINQLANSFLTQEEFAGQLDPTQCDFGSWYYLFMRSDDFAATTEEFQLVFLAIEQPHQELHQSAQKIVELTSGSGEPEAQVAHEQALAVYQQETRAHLGQVATLLHQLKGIYEQEQKAQLAMAREMESRASTYILLTLVVALVVGIAAYSYISKAINKPIAMLKGVMAQASNGDLTVEAKALAQDEFGELTEEFNKMLVANRDLVSEVNQAVELLSSSSQEINMAVDQANVSMQEITISVEKVSQGAEINANALREASKGTDEVASSAQYVAEASQQAAEGGSAANQQAQATAEVMEQVVSTVTQLDIDRQEIDGVISQLVEATKTIVNFVNVITSIAEQTNLLALNAAIESARAGEQGRGFAVVAEEIRKLAEHSSQAAQEIGHLITDVHEKADRAVHTSEKTGEQILASVSQVGEAKKRITEIVSAIEKVNDKVQDMAATAQEQSALSQEMTAAVSDIVRVTEETAASSQQISAGVQEQSATLEEIGASTNELEQMAHNLMEKVQMFKVK